MQKKKYVILTALACLLVVGSLFGSCGEDSEDIVLSPFENRISLNGTWKFQIDPDRVGTSQGWQKPDYADGAWKDIEVPGNWNYLFRDDPVPESESDYDKTAWYRRTFTAPDHMQGRHVKLHFGAVCYKSELWLNGEWIGEHEGDFVPFEFEVSSRLRYGQKNLLAVRVETINAESVDTVPPAVGRYDYWIYSGIHRDVFLEARDPINVFDLFVHAEPTSEGKAHATVEVRILNSGDSAKQVLATVSIHEKDQSDAVAALGKTLHIPQRMLVSNSFEMSIEDPNPWSPETPNLYDCRVELSPTSDTADLAELEYEVYDPDSKLPPRARISPIYTDRTDAAQARFGIRKIETRGTDILLNGEPLIFKGINRSEDYPLLGRTVPDSIYQEDLTRIKRANINAVRTAHYPNDPRIYDFCDELGLLAIEEIPCISLTRQEMTRDAIVDLSLDYTRRMVHRDKNHPSIVIWSAGDEPELFGSSEFNSRIYEEMKQIDPTRLVSYARIHYDLICRDDQSDVIMLNPYWGWYVGSVEDTGWFLDLARSLFPDKPIILGEFGAGGVKDYRSLDDPISSPHFTEDYMTYHLKATWAIARSKPYVSGGLIWTFADFISPTRKYLRSNQYAPDSFLNPVPYHNFKGIVDRYRRPKNAFLTVLGMYGGMTLHHLTVDVVDSSGNPFPFAEVNVFLEDGTWACNQTTDENGRIIFWYIPPLDYQIVATAGELSRTIHIDMEGDQDVVVQVPGSNL